MRRRRRRRWYWLPTQGIAGIDALDSEATYWDSFVVPINQTGVENIVIRDFTFDSPFDVDDAAANDPMSLFLRSGYMLRRVVGNVYVHLEATSAGGSGTGVQAAAVTYAMFVAREDQATVQPPGTTSVAFASQNYGPQHVNNVREPYIFHRNWIIGFPNATGFANLSNRLYPPTNAGYGSAYEGSFVDQKTLRRIDGDNRLWHCIQVRHHPFNTTHDGAVNLVATVMLRILGRPITAAKSGTM